MQGEDCAVRETKLSINHQALLGLMVGVANLRDLIPQMDGVSHPEEVKETAPPISEKFSPFWADLSDVLNEQQKAIESAIAGIKGRIF